MTNEEKLNEYLDLKGDIEELVNDIVNESYHTHLGGLVDVSLQYSKSAQLVKCEFWYEDFDEEYTTNITFPVELLDQTQPEWEAWWKKQEEDSEKEVEKESLHSALVQASSHADVVKKAVDEGVLGNLSYYNERLEFINKYFKGELL